MSKVTLDLLTKHRVNDPGEIDFKGRRCYVLGILMFEPSHVPHILRQFFLDVCSGLYLQM
jgi:hypothetical protein